MRRALVGIVAAAGLALGGAFWGPAIAAGGGTLVASCVSEECGMGLHEFCPDSTNNSESFACECSCHDNMFELEARELGWDL